MSGAISAAKSHRCGATLRALAVLRLRSAGLLPVLLTLALAAAGLASPAWAQSAAALRSRQLELRDQMSPCLLHSDEEPGSVFVIMPMRL